MPIAHIQHPAVAIGDNGATASQAFGSNVTAGSLIIVTAHKWAGAGGSDPFIAADCSKASGTATIETVALDLNRNQTLNSQPYHTAVFSALVTGTGSLTMQVAGSSDSYLMITMGEFSGSWDSSRLETSAGTGDDTDNPTSASTGDATSAGAALFIGNLGLDGSGTITIGVTGTGWNEIAESQEASSHITGSASYKIQSSGATDAATWSLSGTINGFNAIVVVFKEAGIVLPTMRTARIGGLQRLASDEDDGHFNDLDVRNWFRKRVFA
jgi:hypothetical protein